MLKVSVEVWPGGRESARRVIATANIGRVRDGRYADYQVSLDEVLLGEVGVTALVHSYPRWSGSVWDLVARSIAVAINGGNEGLPERPSLPAVPVHVRSDGVQYVREDEIPEPTRTFFQRNLDGSGIPDRGCAFAHDWEDFLDGYR